MTTRPLLVLDFDGVICDSVDECFASSWTAYHQLHRGEAPGAPDQSVRAAFAALRPYVRSGEDFVLIQEIVARGGTVSSQASFDETALRGGDAARAQYRELFYQARADFLRRDRAGWLALNRVYPHVARALARLPSSAPLYILSTKKPAFIAEILSAQSIAVDPQRIIWSDAEPKLVTVERLRSAYGAAAGPGGSPSARALFIEDQVDAIMHNTNPLVRVFLATWGYVQEAWLAPDGPVPLLAPQGFLDLLEAEFGQRD
jgi:phosphoglycolate phosphatase-like HAD superfamily hydrolase